MLGAGKSPFAAAIYNQFAEQVEWLQASPERRENRVVPFMCSAGRLQLSLHCYACAYALPSLADELRPWRPDRAGAHPRARRHWANQGASESRASANRCRRSPENVFDGVQGITAITRDK